MKKYSVCVIVLLFWCLPARATEKHPFGIDDWAGLRRATAIAMAPDGATILYRVDFGGAKGLDQHEWRLIAADGSNRRTLRLPEHFRPFGFTREGSGLYGEVEDEKAKTKNFEIVSITAPEGKPVTFTSVPEDFSTAVISPDGSRFAMIASPRPRDPLAEVHTVVENKPASVYVINADGSGGGWWCSSLTQVAEITWKPDGSSIAILSQTPMIGFHYVHSFIDVCSASETRRVTEIQNASVSEAPQGYGGIAWTRDGAELAFLSTTTDVLTPDHVWTVPVAGGAAVDRTPNLAASAMGIVGDTRGNIWVSVARGVRSEIDSFANHELKPAFEWPGGIVEDIPVFPEVTSAPERLVFTVGDPEHSANVAIEDGSKLKKITNEGNEQLAGVALGPSSIVHWTSNQGIHLEGIATFPAGYASGKQYPFLVFPHGGPEANDTFTFDAFARLIAASGYVVLQPEYRGSTGYGSEFLNSIYQHFGDRAYSDVDSATDFAIAQGWADPAKLAIFGWSAGGFMTSWTVTQTHRYRAAVEGAGITDWLSFIWTSDVQQIDYDARWPEKDPDAFLKFSAVMHAEAVTTPLLILHGAADERVPTYQGHEYYLALAAHGKTVRMVTYPGSPHFPKLWEQRADVFREIAAWLARYNP
ncbi:MAG: prolyl oligopeptidase family serine peptidase [Candidatus Acidiferrales bacterium]